MVAESIARADLTAKERRGAAARSRDAQAAWRMLALAPEQIVVDQIEDTVQLHFVVACLRGGYGGRWRARHIQLSCG